MTAATFGLTPAARDLEVPGGFTTVLRQDGKSKSPVSYMDFTVDGAPLFVDLAAGTPDGLDFVGVLQRSWPIETTAAIERLIGEAQGDLPDGRVSLYVCPECGNLGCGAVTGELVLGEDVVIWKAIGQQTDYDRAIAALGEDGVLPEIAFIRDSYESVLRRELATMRQLTEGFEYPYQRERRLRRERRRARLRRLLRGD